MGDASEASLLEAEFSATLGTRYAVAVNSCGSAMFLALLCTGVKPGNRVLMNAFTLAPVPGAVAHAGAEHVLVDVTPDLVIDLDDLAAKAAASGARHLLLSHMRGHIADMGRLMALCDHLGLIVIEDCAHTMGANWAGRPTNTFGQVGCFSLQSYKHVNGGEGGLLATDDADEVFARWRDVTPNFSLRMSNLVAAAARPQLPLLAERARIWNDRYGRLATALATLPGLRLPHRPQEEEFVQSSIQLAVAGLCDAAFASFLEACRLRGVYLKWFGAKQAAGYTSVSVQWRFLSDPHTPPVTARVLERLCDMRIPLTLTEAECGIIGGIIAEELAQARRRPDHPHPMMEQPPI